MKFLVIIPYFILLIAPIKGIKGTSVESKNPRSNGVLTPENIRGAPQHMERTPIIEEEENCSLSPDLVEEIKGYESTVNLIIETALRGDFKGRTYDVLARFVDEYVNRLTGSAELESAIDYMMDKMRADGLENVRGEDVEVPRWIRGEENAAILEPVFKKLEIIGLGGSPGTPPQGIIGEVIVVESFDDLENKKDIVNGKIVVYNQGWLGSYGATTGYRTSGPARAAEHGAIAALVESVTSFSLSTPHTGHTNFGNGTTIPAASITKEDAEFFSRIYNRGEKIMVNLTMLDELLEETGTSRNSFGEIVGSELPGEIVGVSGHIDAWDVGQGALDDAGGVVISTEALALIQHLGLRPKRTLQAILWTAEEFGLIGVQSFVNQHKEEMVNYNAVFESDSGTFKPIGLDFAGTPEAGCIIQEILKLMAPLNATNYARYPDVSSDIIYMTNEGVPSLSLNTVDTYFWWYHHAPSDMVSALDPVEMDMNTAIWASVSYVVADLSISLPRLTNPSTETTTLSSSPPTEISETTTVSTTPSTETTASTTPSTETTVSTTPSTETTVSTTPSTETTVNSTPSTETTVNSTPSTQTSTVSITPSTVSTTPVTETTTARTTPSTETTTVNTTPSTATLIYAKPIILSCIILCLMLHI